MIANIAFVFHWPHGELIEMDVMDLIKWSRLAIDRHNAANKAEDS